MRRCPPRHLVVIEPVPPSAIRLHVPLGPRGAIRRLDCPELQLLGTLSPIVPDLPATAAPNPPRNFQRVARRQEDTAGCGNDPRSVQALLPITYRQRHVDCGQSNSGKLGTRHRTRPAQRQVGGSVGKIHAIHIVNAVITPCVTIDEVSALIEIGGADDMEDLAASSRDRPTAASTAVFTRRAPGTAEDKQTRLVRIEAEVVLTNSPRRGAIEVDDCAAKRDSQRFGIADGTFEGLGDIWRHPSTDLVRQARLRIRFAG